MLPADIVFPFKFLCAHINFFLPCSGNNKIAICFSNFILRCVLTVVSDMQGGMALHSDDKFADTCSCRNYIK